MARDLYKIQNREVEPVNALLRSIVELNWHANRAMAEGWSVDLSINDESGMVSVSVSRSDCWPTEDSEAEAERVDD